jgi:hypothetical protein
MKIFLLAFIAFPAFAEGPQHQQGGGHRGPPPEALAACKGRAAGDSCSFSSPHGDSVSGTCFTPDSSKPVACKPAGGPPGGGGGHGGGGQDGGGGGQY